MNDELTKAREELDKEFQQFREHLTKIHAALDHVEKAGPMDDVEQLLEDLEDTVKKVRTGGVFGAGAKGHTKARKHFLEIQGKPA
jgi:uncharacterized coiled-coil DUF342 family protein